MFLQHKADHIDILSGLFEINFYYCVSCHILYYFNLMMMSGVCKSQVTKFCRVVPEYGDCFMLQFWQDNYEISYRFLENLWTHILRKD
jgi:hypothetical protein